MLLCFMSFLATIPIVAQDNPDGQANEEWNNECHDQLGWDFDLDEVEAVEALGAGVDQVPRLAER